MELEMIELSEISQTQENKPCFLSSLESWWRVTRGTTLEENED